MVWPFRSRTAVPAYRIWMGHQARVGGVVRAVGEAVAAGGGVVLGVHFAETAAWWTRQLDELGGPWSLVDAADAGDAGAAVEDHARAGGGGVLLLHSEQAVAGAGGGAGAPEAGGAAAGWRWHVVEAHPLPGPAEAVDALARRLGCAAPVHHASLEDPLLQMFNGAGSQALMRKLGLAEDEPVDGGVLARSVVKAQQKVAAAVGDAPRAAESQAAWLEANRALSA